MTAHRVAIFVPTLMGGGAERNMVNLANGLAKQGRSVQLIAAQARGVFVNEVTDGVDLIDLDSSRVLSSLVPLANHLRKSRPDVLLSTMNHANVVAIGASMILGNELPVFVREANTLSYTMKNAKSSREKVVPVLAQCLYPRARRIIAPSTGVAVDLVEQFGMPSDRTVVLHNPVVDATIEERANAYQPEVFDDGIPVILGCGSFTDQKDFNLLIRAFASVRARQDVKLVILGDGALRQSYEKLARALKIDDRLHLPGFVENPFAYMSRAAVFVLSSRWEGLPSVPIQAMACGCPVVSTDCPSGPREILKDGEFGRLVPVGSVDRLSEAIEATLNEKTDQGRLKLRAADFTIAAISEQYASLFDASYQS